MGHVIERVKDATQHSITYLTESNDIIEMKFNQDGSLTQRQYDVLLDDGNRYDVTITYGPGESLDIVLEQRG